MEDEDTPENLLKSDFEGHTGRLRQLADNPDQMASHISEQTGDLHDTAPNVVQSMHNTMIQGLNFLHSKMPHPMAALPFTGDKWESSSLQKDQYKNYYNAVNDPISILKEIKEGTLTGEHMEALQTVHPELLNDMRSRIKDAFDETKDQKLPYSTKIALAKFLGAPLDAHMLPQSIVANQMTFVSQNQGQQAAAPTGRRGRATIGKGGFSTRAQTETRADEVEPT